MSVNDPKRTSASTSCRSSEAGFYRYKNPVQFVRRRLLYRGAVRQSAWGLGVGGSNSCFDQILKSKQLFITAIQFCFPPHYRLGVRRGCKIPSATRAVRLRLIASPCSVGLPAGLS